MFINHNDKDDFFKTIQDRVIDGYKLGVEQGWWKSFDNKGPIPWPFIIDLKTKEIWYRTTLDMKRKSEEWNIKCESENGQNIWIRKINEKTQFMSQLLVECGIFESVSDAKNAGWNRRIETGNFWLFKRTVNVIIEDGEEE